MIKIENSEVMGWEHAIRGMRNPFNSWDKSDSLFFDESQGDIRDITKKLDKSEFSFIDLGPEDHKLMMKLAKGGSVHAKYRRMITVYVDITAPLYWWKEFDTYKVGTVANSCSTMHKIHEKEFTMDDFSHEHLFSFTPDNSGFAPLSPMNALTFTIDMLNEYRDNFIKTKEKIKNANDSDEEKRLLALSKEYWWQMIQLLPSSYNQKRTVMLNYEVLVGIYKWRKDHKLDEWREFCKWIESLQYSEIITGEEEK